MLRNYLKIALRNLAKQKGLAFINIFGLSVGLACFSLFMLYAVNEFSFDRFHKNAANIYRVYEWMQGTNGGDASASTNLPMPVGPAMKQDLADIVNTVRIRVDRGESLMRIGNAIQRVKISFADPKFFSVFTFPLKYGNANAALQSLSSIVLTASKAKALFGTENIIGRTVQIKIDNTFKPFLVTGVAQDIPPNSSIHFDILGNFAFTETTEEGKEAANNWHLGAYQTFVQLRAGSPLPYHTARLIGFRKKYYPDEAAKIKLNGRASKQNTPPVTYGLQPLGSMHTDAKINDGNTVNTKTIWILLSIAAGILLIACINFTTLAIGRSAGRSKEVGVRKVVGAAKKQLIFQFLAESFLLTVLSTVISFILIQLLLPYFNRLSGQELQFSFALYPEMIWLLTGLVLLVGLLSGSYPALVLSNFNLVEVLKSKTRIGGSNLFTKSLVTLQFALSIGLIISTVVILRQTKYMSNKNPGFDKENVILVDASETDTKRIVPLFKQELATHSEIAGITSASIGLGEGEEFGMNVFKYNNKGVGAFFNSIDADYIKVLGMQLLAGRNFNAAHAEDTVSSVIVNEALMKNLGWTLQNAVGQELKGFSPTLTPVVIGVVKDFNYMPLREKLMPQLFCPFLDPNRQKIFIRIKPGNPERSVSLIQKAWKSLVPDVPLTYSFLDEKLNNYYKAEQRWSGIVGWAGGISIFLACLGLFGLAALAAVNRIKEIGVRKVLGASVSNIVTLLSKDFLKLILIALCIASPAAWYFMNNWLQSFAYRINISWLVFATVGLFAIAIAFITISFQSIKAATANPVKSLRTE